MLKHKKEMRKKFGANVKKYRNLAGLTQEKLAELTDCSSQTISGIESGNNFPSYTTLFNLSNSLNVPLVYLFNFGEDSELNSKEENYRLEKALKKLNSEEKELAIKIINAIIK